MSPSSRRSLIRAASRRFWSLSRPLYPEEAAYCSSSTRLAWSSALVASARRVSWAWAYGAYRAYAEYRAREAKKAITARCDLIGDKLRWVSFVWFPSKGGCDGVGRVRFICKVFKAVVI